MKRTLVSLLLLFVAVLLLTIPWYQVTTYQPVTNTFTQTYTQTASLTFQVASTSEQSQTVYMQPNAVTVQGTANAVNCVTAPSASTCGAWASTPFILEKGSSVAVNCSCHEIVGVSATFPPYTYVDFTLNGKPPTNETAAIVPVTGLYDVWILNLLTTPVTETGITVIEQTPVITSSAETSYQTAYNIEFNTVNTSVASFTQVAPYSVVGILPSAILLVAICVVVLFVALLERGIISVSIGQRRRKRRK